MKEFAGRKRHTKERKGYDARTLDEMKDGGEAKPLCN
jgi:hypothetical protein